KEATKAGFTIVIGKSDNGGNRRKPYFLLSCSRGGVYKENKRKLKKQDTATKTLKCPFRLRGYFLASQEWKLSVVCGEHNHEMAKTLEGHTLAGCLKLEEKECVQKLTRNLLPPKNILTTLKGRNPESKTNMKQVYNARERTVGDGESKTIQDFFWAHPESVKLFNTFPTVLMMDSTYKTNKYKMPLFEIVGVTSTEDSFNVGFAFIANEKEDNFIWALETCKSLLKSKDTFPKVIVTDRDKSLMNAVPIVFPNSTALVCRYHVAKNGEEDRSRECGRNRKKCGCVIKRTYGLPCACLLALKIDKKLPIRLDEINTHCKRLQIGEDDDERERLNSSDYAMNLQIRDQLRQIAYPEITSLTPPVKQFEIKGSKKRGKSANSSTREPSLWEHIDAQFPDSQASQSKPSIPKRKTARIGNLSPNAIPRRVIKYIEYMPLFMHSYIEDIIDVKGDGHCGFRVVAEC
ncbi:hypothetical protein TSUD_419180, partial [Trifolium subterraneum]